MAELAAPLSKSDFVGIEDLAWLFTGAESPLHKGVAEAVDEYLQRRTHGPRGREFNAQVEESCRARFARLLGGAADDIALLSNASEAIASVMLSLRLRPGDNVVLHDLEYPSAVLSSLALRETGVEVRVVPHQGWKVSTETLMAQVDERTRAVVTSHVSYLSGTRLNPQELYQQLQQTSASLLLDATQSLGVVPVDMKHADFVVCSSYKWLLGIHGAGILAVNPQRTGHLVPVATGWRSVGDVFSSQRFERVERFAGARRYEVGFPSFPTIAALNRSLELLLDTGIQRIESHILTLGQKLIEGLHALGLQVMTPSEPSQRAGNIAFVCDRGEEVAAKLSEAGVLVWGGDGRVRLSIHGFNTEADIERALRALEKVVR